MRLVLAEGHAPAADRLLDGHEAVRAVWVAQREATVTAHLPLVRHCAVRAVKRLQQAVLGGAIPHDVEDLVSAGTIGLLDAVDRFDPTTGLAFTTFATPRIRGAILDELRRVDVRSRRVRERAGRIRRTRALLEHEQGRAASSREVATRLGIPWTALLAWEQDVATGVGPAGDAPELQSRALDNVADDRALSADALVIRESDLAALRRGLCELPERTRTILALAYVEEISNREIARALGLTDGRVSQLRKDGLERLRKALLRTERQARPRTSAAA